MIVQGRGNCIQIIDNEIVAQLVQVQGRYACFYVWLNKIQYTGSQPTSDSHFFDFLWGLDHVYKQ